MDAFEETNRKNLIFALAQTINNGGFKKPGLRSVLIDLIAEVNLPDNEKLAALIDVGNHVMGIMHS